jgi:hypothetical protein
MSDLPDFLPREYSAVHKFASRALTNPQRSPKTQLRELIAYEDGHYRALFSPDYFILPEGQAEPTKSQWNTFKKHLKRQDKRVFIFKAHGEADCGGERCYYVDFGFLRWVD